MKADEFTAIIDKAPEGGYWAICPEICGANGQGEAVEEAKIVLEMLLNLFWKIGERMFFAGYLKISSDKAFCLHETSRSGAKA